MPWYRIHGQLVHMRGTKLPKPCQEIVEIDGRKQRCMGMSGFECDWPIDTGRTCDLALCEQHASEVGNNRHFCPAHLADHFSGESRKLFTGLPGVTP